MTTGEFIQEFIDYTGDQLLRRLLQKYRKTLGESQDVQVASLHNEMCKIIEERCNVHSDN
jgi:hypothetical protein